MFDQYFRFGLQVVPLASPVEHTEVTESSGRFDVGTGSGTPKPIRRTTRLQSVASHDGERRRCRIVDGDIAVVNTDETRGQLRVQTKPGSESQRNCPLQ
jgi:hypothetical protein